MAENLHLDYLNTMDFPNELSTLTFINKPKDTLKELCDLVGISSEYVKEEELCTPTKRLKSEHPYNSCCLYSPESTSSCDQLKTQFENKVCNINENIPKVTI